MKVSLIPCESCNRHIALTESACPFCGRTVGPDAAAKVRAWPAARLGRAAIVAFGTTVAGASCSDSHGPVGAADASQDAVAESAADTSPDATTEDVTADPDGSPVALYGAPAPDPDAGPDESFGARYGAPPPS